MWHLRRLMDLPIRDHRRDTLLFVRRRNLRVFSAMLFCKNDGGAGYRV